ncbi:tripartite tricarboxylate transporter permease [Natronohydrobacter thiooxidans]|uniref:tripartite tricarboxylate transporter permease n=1 Tax=Natronohydrobacter thiooxidans TaxID=87172 RepID=UPI0008FF1137|nr:tripartite tricarboxylate transporter permease [Natronohydrobacter thiooxidans]
MALFLDVAAQLLSFSTLFWITVGTVIGVILGAIPGLGAAIGVVLLLPFTYSMDPAQGLLLLGGVFMGGSYGGVIPGILLNIPGTATAVMSTLEGHPMAKRGQAREALIISVLASGIGGVMGVLAMIFLTPTLASVALRFGPPELFLVGLLGLTLVGTLTGDSLWKGIFAACVGIMLSMVGQDMVTGGYRFTFGIDYLGAGLHIVPLIVGLFALSEMIAQFARAGSKEVIVATALEKIGVSTVWRDLRARWSLMARSSVIGVIAGIIPGTGAAIASFMSYGEARRISKSPETFGQGNPEALTATETSNNAAVGGALIPLLALGIPGSATASIIYAAMTLHGLVPGPRLFSQNPDLAYVFMVGMLFTVLVMCLIGIFAVPWFSLIAKVRMTLIVPAVSVFALIGAYSARNSFSDMVIAVIFGVMALFFRKAGIPVAPVVLGFILGPVVESNFRRSIVIAGARNINTVEFILFRPLAAVVIVIVALVLISSFRSTRNAAKQ